MINEGRVKVVAETKDYVIEPILSEQLDQEIGVPLYRIVSFPADYTLDGLYQKMVRGDIFIPHFQRAWVWDHVRASRLIESFLMGLPVPGVFLYKESSQRLLIVDGQQRLRTVRAFFDGTLQDGKEFFLKGVDPKWEGDRYVDLSPEDALRLSDSVLRAVIIEQLDPRDNTSVYHIFERLNTGGVGLTPQEVRNSSYHGQFNDVMVELNRTKTWRHVFGTKNPDGRMRDIELIVRFLALFETGDRYEKPMKTFLNKFMAQHQKDTNMDPYEKLFLDTVRRVGETLGPKPFHIKRGINAAVFDSVMVAFARSSFTPEDIADRFERLNANLRYQEATSSSTTDVDTVKSRIALAEEILFK